MEEPFYTLPELHLVWTSVSLLQICVHASLNNLTDFGLNISLLIET